MGNKETTGQDYLEKFNSKYDFTALVDDPNFGQIKVYRKKELNFDYVMVLQKYIPPSRVRSLTEQIRGIHAAFLQPNQPMALRIFNFDVLEDHWSECKIPMVRLYVEYFNFTLHDLIQRHRQKGDSFSPDEIIYIVHSVLITYDFFSKFSQQYLMASSKAIYLSTEGCIKFSPIKADNFFQESNALCKAMFNETKHREVINFERGQRQLISEIRKLVNEIMQLNYRGIDGRKAIELAEKIKKCNTFQKMKKVVGVPGIECLQLGKKERMGQSLASYPTNKTQKSISPSEDAVKMSIRKQLKISQK